MPNEHPYLARQERKLFFDEKDKKHRKETFDLDAYVKSRRTALHEKADALYEEWGGAHGPNKLELGYAFEKEAYGAFDPGKKGNWAEQYIEKFEAMYQVYLQLGTKSRP